MKQHKIKLIVRNLGLQEFEPVWKKMQAFTATRDDSTADELWCLQHPAVFTMGLNGKKEHLLNIKDIPVINTDRGGQVTYHGPGQLIIYTLIDLKRLNIGVKELVSFIEKAVIQLLHQYGINASNKKNAPGVYVNDEKVAALGLRIKRNKSYHGLALNIDMDLSPFKQINPCGYANMRVTQLSNLNVPYVLNDISNDLVEKLGNLLGYTLNEISKQANEEKCEDEFS